MLCAICIQFSAVQWFHSTDVVFLTFIRNLRKYIISRLLEACYLCTSMGKPITKTCWINLLLCLLFFTANKELKQPYRAIIREIQCYECRKEPSENHQNPFSITAAALLNTDCYCQGTLKRTLDR